MRTLLILVVFIFINGNISGQTETESIETELQKLNKKFDSLTEKKIQFGLSIGYRYISKSEASQHQIASISPTDSTLQLDLLDDDAVILSTSIIFNPKIPTQQLSRQINEQISAYVINQNKDKKFSELSAADQMILKNTFSDIEASTLIGSGENVLTATTQNNTSTSEINPFLVFESIGSLKDEIQKLKSANENDPQIRVLKRTKRKIRRLIFLKYFIDYFVDRVSINANLNLIEFSSAQQELSFNKSLEGGLGVSYMLNKNLYIGGNYDVFFSRQLHSHLKQLEGQQITNQGSTISSSSELDPENNDLFLTKNINGFSLKIIATF